jgi:hypothetical protein
MNYQQSLEAGGNVPKLEPSEEEEEDGFDGLHGLLEDSSSVRYRILSLSGLDSLYRLPKGAQVLSEAAKLVSVKGPLFGGVRVWQSPVMSLSKARGALIKSR